MKTTEHDSLHRWCHQRDPQAFEAIVHSHARMVYGTCLRIVRDPAEAQDLAQECFELLLHPLPREPRSLGAWLHGVATHRARMRLRSDARRQQREANFASVQLPLGHALPDDTPQVVDETLEQLPEDLQDLLIRHYFLDQSHHEIARRLRIPRRTISHRIERALEHLADGLRQRGIALGTLTLATFLTQLAVAAPPLPPSFFDKIKNALETARPALAPAAVGNAPYFSTSKAITWLVLGLALVTGPITYVAYSRGSTSPPSASAGNAAPAPLAPQSAPVPTATSPASAPTPGVITGTVVGKRILWQKQNISAILRVPKEQPQQELALAMRNNEQPVPGIEVRLLMNDKIVQTTTTDGLGHFEFTGLPLDTYEVAATLPSDAVHLESKYALEHTSITLDASNPMRTVQLPLNFDCAKFSGTIRAVGGAVIANASLHAEVERKDYDGGGEETRGAPMDTHSDEQGRYQLSGIEAGYIQNASGYLAKNGEYPYGDFYAQITARADGYAASTLYAPAITFEALDFTYAYLQRDTELQAGIGNPHFDPVLLRATADRGFTSADFTLVPEAVVSGVLVDSSGTPIPDTRLRMFFQAEPAKPRAFVQTTALPGEITTGVDGSFALNQLGAETYRFSANIHENWKEAFNDPLTLATGEHLSGLQVVMPAMEDLGRVVAKVTTSDGKRVPRLEVWTSDFEPDDGKTEKNGKLALTEDGFTFDEVPPGIFTFQIKADGFATQFVRAKVAPDATTNLDIVLIPEAVLSGTVTRNGEPCAYGYVTLDLDPNHQHDTSPNEQGHYELKAMTAGDHTFKFTIWLYEDERGGAQQTTRRQATLRAGETTRLDITLAGNATLEGDFEGPDDLAWFVHLYDGDPRVEANRVAGTWKFKKNHHYELPHLPPGTYTAVGKCLHDDTKVLELARPVVLIDDTITTLDFHFPVEEVDTAPTP